MENTYQKGHITGKVYFYIQRGLALVNEFKYLVAGIIAFYYMLKLDNVKWLVGIMIISFPVLFIIGWFYVHKIAKVFDWLTVEYGTHWSRYSFTLQEKIVEELEKLNKLCQKK